MLCYCFVFIRLVANFSVLFILDCLSVFSNVYLTELAFGSSIFEEECVSYYVYSIEVCYLVIQFVFTLSHHQNDELK